MTYYLYGFGYAITAIAIDVLLYDEQDTDLAVRLSTLLFIYIISLAWPLVWIVVLCHVAAKLIRRRLGL
jgi:flagellar biosynthesis protein FliR